MEKVYPRKLSFSKLIMVIIVGVMFFILGKQFFYKNILFPNTLVNNNNTEEITRIVVENIPTPYVVEKIVTQEVIKEIFVEVTPTPSGKIAKGRYSWYYPPLGGINCDRDQDGNEECTYVANGDEWQIWYEKGCACPAEIPLGSQIKIKELGLTLTCVDRGGAIIVDQDGYYWIDHLTNSPRLYWSSPITIEIIEN